MEDRRAGTESRTLVLYSVWDLTPWHYVVSHCNCCIRLNNFLNTGTHRVKITDHVWLPGMPLKSVYDSSMQMLVCKKPIPGVILWPKALHELRLNLRFLVELSKLYKMTIILRAAVRVSCSDNLQVVEQFTESMVWFVSCFSFWFSVHCLLESLFEAREKTWSEQESD